MNIALLQLMTGGLLLVHSLAGPARAADVWLDAAVNAVGERFLVDVYVQDAPDVYGLAFDVAYSSATRSVFDADGDAANGVQPLLVEGDALSEGGAVETFLEGELEDGVEGRLVIGHTRVGAAGGADLSTPSLLLSFWLTRDGATSGNLTIENLYVENESGTPVVFNVLPTAVSRSTGTVVVDVAPGAASWTLIDSEGDVTNGTGDRTLVGVPGGNATVIWGTLANYDAPGTSTSRYVARNVTTTFEGVYERHVGVIEVDVAPENASWSFTDGDGAVTTGTGDQTVAGVPTGAIAFTWDALAGLSSPVAPDARTLEQGGALRYFGLYMQPGKGAVAIDVTPDSAPWSFKDGGNNDYSGTGDDVRTAIDPGNVTLTWGELANFEKPAPDVAIQTLAAGSSVTFTGVYTAYVGTVEVAVSPATAGWSFTDGIGGVHAGVGARTLSDIPIGDVTLSWGPLANYDAPTTGPVTLALTRNGTVRFEGAYARHAGVLAIEASPEAAPWALTGPDGLALSDSGSTTILAAPTGGYAIEWLALGGWDSPEPSSETLTLARDERATFTAVYARQLGAVFVEVTPGAASWSLTDGDGALTTGSGNASLTDVPTGDVTLTWGALEAHDGPEPSPETKTLTKGSSVTFSGAYARWTGTVEVDVTPDSATWFLEAGDGSVRNGVGDAVEQDVATGEIRLTWGELAGYAAPEPNPDARTLAKDATLAFAGSYVRHTGTLAVEVTPEEAPWTLTGPEGFALSDAGTTRLLGALVGAYTIEWLALEGWESPDPATRTLSVARDAATTLTGVYARSGGTVLVEVTPEAASWSFVDGEGAVTSGTGDASVTGVPEGTVTLSWLELAGYVAPSPNPTTRTLAAGGVTTFTGVYVGATGDVAVSVTPAEAPWSLAGPQGFLMSDTGSTALPNVSVGDYTITWEALAGYDSPEPASRTLTLAQDGAATFTAAYVRQSGTVVVDATPDSAPWSFIDGDGVVHPGTGDETVTGVPTGELTLTWGALANYDPPLPNPTTGTLAAGTTATFSGVYARQTGTVAVDVTPEDAAWILTGPEGFALADAGSSTVLGVAAGDYTIAWQPLEGWSAPAPTTRTLAVLKGQTTTFSGVYGFNTATVEVRVTPDAAGWTLLDSAGGQHQGGGDQTIGNVPTGVATLTWESLAGYDPPAPNPTSQTLETGQTAIFTGVYARHTGTVIVDVTPDAAPWTLTGPDGLVLDSSGTTTLLAAPTGDYTIAWKALTGYDSPEPASRTLTLAQGAAATFAGAYARQTGTVVVDVAPDSASWTLTDGDGVAHERTGGATLTDVPTGEITLTWDALAGYDAPTPNPMRRTLAQGATVAFPGLYRRQTGTVAVDVTPEEASWSLTGPEGFALADAGSTTVLAVPTGDYTIAWGPLEGWSAPVPTTRTLAVLKDQTTTFSGAYGFNTATVEVRVTPDAAGWTLLDSAGGQHQGGGDQTIGNVPTGVATLTWESLAGYDPPAPNPTSQTLETGQTAIFTGVYTRHTGTVIVDVTPDEASWSFTDGDGIAHSGTGDATVTDVPTGGIALAWQALAGYALPADNPDTRTLTQGQSVTIAGVYTPLALAPDAPSGPDPADGAEDVPTTTVLAWAPAARATSYDLYLWREGQTAPTTPTAVGLTTPAYQPAATLYLERIHHWRVVAKNGDGVTTGPVWSFLTKEPTGIRDLVTHFYVVVLGRNPETGAVDAWQLGYDAASSMTIDVRFILREMGRRFFLSEEYASRGRDDAQFIVDSYEAFLLRTPGPDEIQPWLDDVVIDPQTQEQRVRWNRGEVMTQFAESLEFGDLIAGLFPGQAGLPTRNFVTAMYIGIFDRLVDSGGLEYFSGRMDAAPGLEGKRAEAKQIAREFFASPEGQQKAPDNATRVVRLYRAFLGRYPEGDAADYWTGLLDSGAETLDTLIDSFGAAQEFTDILSKYF